MRIEPTSGQVPVSQTQATAKPAAKAVEAGTSSESATFSPTSALSGLLSAVQASPDVRADVVEAVTARLAAGELSTQLAASQTAEALLNAGELSAPISES